MVQVQRLNRRVLVALLVATVVAPTHAGREEPAGTASGPIVVKRHAIARTTAVVSANGHRLPDEQALSAVGQLLADDSSCSASVVASSSGRLVLTAAHCVFTPAATERLPDVAAGKEPGWVDDMVFVPARSGDDAPLGVWPVERMWVARAWQTDAAPEVDVAVVELRDAASGTAQEVLGALGIRFDGGGRDGAGPTVDVFGYPTAAQDDGTRRRSCEQVVTDAGQAGLLEAVCGLGPGASGGPWIVPDRGWWSAVAVTSYLSWDRPGTLGGARLGAVAERLWRAADEAASQ